MMDIVIGAMIIVGVVLLFSKKQVSDVIITPKRSKTNWDAVGWGIVILVFAAVLIEARAS